MKKIKLLTLLLGISGLLLVSCQKKNKDAADTLGGSWNIVAITKASGPVDANAMPQGVILNSCNSAKDPCSGEWTSNNGDKGNFTWTITEKGEIFNITPNMGTIVNQATSDLADYQGDYDIIELTDTKFLVQKGETKLEFGR